MATYTADDFARADFARHPDGGLAMRVRPLDVRPWETWHCYASDATMALTGWVPVPHGSYNRHESPDYADGGVTAAAIEKEAERRPFDSEVADEEWLDARYEAALDQVGGDRATHLDPMTIFMIGAKWDRQYAEPRPLTAREHLDAAIALMDAKR